MGFYIERNSKGEPLGRDKAESLIADGAVEVKGELVWSPDLVCVVQNGLFDAAGYAYSKQEMESFAWTGGGRDNRPRRWLRYPHVREAMHSKEAYDDLRAQYPNG